MRKWIPVAELMCGCRDLLCSLDSGQVKPMGMEQIQLRCGKKILFSPDLWLLRVIAQDSLPFARLSIAVI